MDSTGFIVCLLQDTPAGLWACIQGSTEGQHRALQGSQEPQNNGGVAIRMQRLLFSCQDGAGRWWGLYRAGLTC